MKLKKIMSSLALALLVALASTAAGPVIAQDGPDDQDKIVTSSDSDAGSDESEDDTASSQRDKKLASDDQTKSENETEDDSAKDRAETHKSRPSGVKKEVRQRKCEAHKHGLETKFKHIVSNSQRIQARIDGILDKALAYQQTNNLEVANFDNLVAAAQTAKTAAGNSVTNLQSITPSLDCNSESVVTDVQNFKTAAKQTRDDLKAYKSAVRAVLKALLTAKSTTEGSSD